MATELATTIAFSVTAVNYRDLGKSRSDQRLEGCEDLREGEALALFNTQSAQGIAMSQVWERSTVQRASQAGHALRAGRGARRGTSRSRVLRRQIRLFGSFESAAARHLHRLRQLGRRELGRQRPGATTRLRHGLPRFDLLVDHGIERGRRGGVVEQVELFDDLLDSDASRLRGHLGRGRRRRLRLVLRDHRRGHGGQRRGQLHSAHRLGVQRRLVQLGRPGR